MAGRSESGEARTRLRRAHARGEQGAGDLVGPNGMDLTGPREIAHLTGLPRYILSHEQTRNSLGIPHRRVRKLIRFDRDEVKAWARRWLQDAKDQCVDAKADPAGRYRSSQQVLASLPA